MNVVLEIVLLIFTHCLRLFKLREFNHIITSPQIPQLDNVCNNLECDNRLLLINLYKQ